MNERHRHRVKRAAVAQVGIAGRATHARRRSQSAAAATVAGPDAPRRAARNRPLGRPLDLAARGFSQAASPLEADHGARSEARRSQSPWMKRSGVGSSGPLGDAEEVEEVPCEHQLDRTRVSGQLVEQRLQFIRRLEDVAAAVAADVAIRHEDEQRVVRELPQVPSVSEPADTARRGRPRRAASTRSQSRRERQARSPRTASRWPLRARPSATRPRPLRGRWIRAPPRGG